MPTPATIITVADIIAIIFVFIKTPSFQFLSATPSTDAIAKHHYGPHNSSATEGIACI